MVYRSSEHESTGYTPQFLVFGQKKGLPIDCLYPNRPDNETTDIHEFVHNRQRAFQRAFELVRHNLNENQNRRNAIYSKKRLTVHHTKVKKFCFIIQPALLEQLLSSQAFGRDPMSLKIV